MFIRQKNGMSLIYAIVFGIVGLAIAALVVFPLNEAWTLTKASGVTANVDADTLSMMGDLLRLLPVMFVIAFVVGLYTTAQFSKNEA